MKPSLRGDEQFVESQANLFSRKLATFQPSCAKMVLWAACGIVKSHVDLHSGGGIASNDSAEYLIDCLDVLVEPQIFLISS